MVPFRTELSLPPSSYKLSLQSAVLTIGSCFADVMGEKLKRNKFQVMVNPFGVLFNPASVCTLLDDTINGQSLPQHMMVERDGMWYHYGLHSSIVASSQEALSKIVSNIQLQVSSFLHQQADCLILTLGTAFVYQLKDTATIVANCHKVPHTFFSRRLLSVEEITQSVKVLLENLIRIRPNLRVILTVSPVRHIKDGIPMNMVSKSILRVACHQLTTYFSHVDYFPSYELLMDDLRDYRFYKKDMIHPSEIAEEYIWEKLAATYFDAPTQQFVSEWEKISKSIAHTPFNPQTAAHQTFLQNTLSKLQALRQQVNVEEEIKDLESRMNR